MSIQGESTYVGELCAFVRLSACPLRCTYCDTEYAFYEGKMKSFDDLHAIVDSYGVAMVEVTGGEPLAQSNTPLFLKELVDKKYKVLIETSGAFSLKDLAPEVEVIMDIKTPYSGELAKMHWDNMAYLKEGVDQIKFVLGNRADFDFAVETCNKYELWKKHTLLLSPVFDQLSLKEVAAWMIESKHPFRLQTQLHKHIWGEAERGV